MTWYGEGSLRISQDPPRVSEVLVIGKDGQRYPCRAEPKTGITTFIGALKEALVSNPPTPTGAIQLASPEDISLGEMRVRLTCELCRFCQINNMTIYCKLNHQSIRTIS